MIPFLARSAVIIKSKNNTSVLSSDYEMAYALGLLCKLGNFQIPQFDSIMELKENLREQINGYQTEEPLEQNLLTMIRRYIPSNIMEEQKNELLLMGIRENKTWDEKEVPTNK